MVAGDGALFVHSWCLRRWLIIEIFDGAAGVAAGGSSFSRICWLDGLDPKNSAQAGARFAGLRPGWSSRAIVAGNPSRGANVAGGCGDHASDSPQGLHRHRVVLIGHGFLEVRGE